MTGTLTIGGVAARTGFSTSALRYYDDVGLVCPSGRTDSGYRTYDEAAVDRLGFIARAKELGCTIDEIRDLLVAWDGGRCGPVQERLRRLVAAKIDEVSARISEADVLRADLRSSARALERHQPVGECDDSCGCLGAAGPTPEWVSLAAKPEISCTLPSSELPDRVTEWRALLEFAATREALVDGMRVEFESSVDHGELIRLVTAEQTCCSFFEFAITVDDRGLALEVRAGPEARGMIEELFGAISAADE